ncbi:MAG: glycosyltransferase family 87 protein [Isosphaeraceae bacterium]|nr:glycosyltransferase family 87 protein [Isosphaeraceae bacterium]
MGLSDGDLSEVAIPALVRANGNSPETPGLGLRVSIPNALISSVAIVFCLWNLVFLSGIFVITKGNDFSRMYQSAVAFWQGGEMYGWNIATPAKLDENHVVDLWNMNPPHFHLVLLPLALLPWQAALALWFVIGFCSLGLSLRLTLRAADVRLTPRATELGLIAVAGFSGTATIFSTGQLTLLMLLPVTLIWLEARRGRWIHSGVYLGLCMSVKPFLLLLLPYFLLSRRWGAAATAVGTAGAAFALGLLMFGVENTQMWYRGLGTVATWDWLPMNASLLGMLHRTFTKTLWYQPVVELSPAILRAAWMVIGGAIGVASLRAAPRDGSAEAVDRAFALLLVTSLVLCPLGWVYYFWLPMGPIIALAAAQFRLGPHRPDASPQQIWQVVNRVVPWWALPGLFGPSLMIVKIFRPNILATLLAGNIYFWSLIGIWGSLLVLAIGFKSRVFQALDKMPVPAVDA